MVLATDVCILIVHIVLNKDMASLEVLDARADVKIKTSFKDNPIVADVFEACSTFITIVKQNPGNVPSVEELDREEKDPSSDLGKAYWEFWYCWNEFREKLIDVMLVPGPG